MSSPSSSSKKIILKSSDGEIFEIEQSVASQFKLIKLMIEDDCADSAIPLPNVTGKILSKVIEFCKERDNSTNWDDNFLKVDQSTLFELILAANYLDIKSLMDLTCKTVADMMRGKNTEELRSTFNIENDFTPQEEEAIRKENEWAFK